jgi:hypothetical protein
VPDSRVEVARELHRTIEIAMDRHLDLGLAA